MNAKRINFIYDQIFEQQCTEKCARRYIIELGTFNIDPITLNTWIKMIEEQILINNDLLK